MNMIIVTILIIGLLIFVPPSGSCYLCTACYAHYGSSGAFFKHILGLVSDSQHAPAATGGVPVEA